MIFSYCNSEAKYQLIFWKFFNGLLIMGELRVIDGKISNFQFCLISMKLKTNDVFAILTQSINKFLKKIERSLRVIYGKNLKFSICLILMKLKTNDFFAILMQNIIKFRIFFDGALVMSD